MDSPKIRRALISVSDKLGLADFGRGLAGAGVELYSTGGTARFLRANDLKVTDISEYTGFPEMMDGRLKTLHPKVFGGILCRPNRDDDMQAIQSHQIASFELVVVNLYPFEATVAKPGVTMPEAIEQIDIGGPSLVRAAAKNHAFVTIATSPEQYGGILRSVEESGQTTLQHRASLAGAAFARTAAYDQAISSYFQRMSDSDERFPEVIHRTLNRQAILRYGENPHQRAAVYSVGTDPGSHVISARQLNGKELSYNNLLDLDAALVIARSFTEPAAAVIKHNNPCGAAVAQQLADAAQKALDGDPVSAFGSILGFNRQVDAATADRLATPGLFIEAVIAPGFDADAVEILTTRPKWKANVRLMEVGKLEPVTDVTHFRQLDGGMLVQESDLLPDECDQWTCVTQAQPDDRLMDELRFSWAIVRHVKSNAIAVTRDWSLCGAGAGQMSRVDSVEIALQKAGERADGAVLASDAFFPFPDSVERATQAGIIALIQPGGSKRDQEVIDACDKYQLPMIFTGRRHFKH